MLKEKDLLMTIKKILIRNFKCFKDDFELDFKNGLNIIVGDNESGKSTILQAIHLALSGWINGRHLYNELSQYLFNYRSVEEYLNGIKNGTVTEPPNILIEIYFDSDESPLLKGNGNSKQVEATGIALKIEFDEKYQEEYEILVKNGDIKSLPIEYYNFYWESFARDEHITPRSIPLKSSLIDTSNTYRGYNAQINRLVKDLLETDEIVDISQAHRSMKDHFAEDNSVKNINKKIQENIDLSNKEFELAVELSSKSAWTDSLITHLDKIPFNHVGSGEQCIVKTKLALSFGRSAEANTILIEEPENHLSHSKLNWLLNDIKTGSSGKQIIINTHSSFVANKLGLDSLILLNDLKTTKFEDLTTSTKQFFEKLSGYDTLRLILCKKVILVEGDSDELIVQRAYMDEHDKLPIEEGVDIISVGTSFLRFLEIAAKINKPTVVITDNDGDIEAIKSKYSDYLIEDKYPYISISYDSEIDTGDLVISGVNFNYNTLEPKIVKANGLETMNKVLETDYQGIDEMHKYMRNNKTECALKIFGSEHKINFPEYIKSVIA